MKNKEFPKQTVTHRFFCVANIIRDLLHRKHSGFFGKNGNGKDFARLLTTNRHAAITRLAVALNRTWTIESGKKNEEVTYVDVDLFGRSAENANEYLRKGSSLPVEGRLKLDPVGGQTDQSKTFLDVWHWRNRSIHRRKKCGRKTPTYAKRVTTLRSKISECQIVF